MRLPEKGKVLKKEKFKVTGMSCSACSSRVEKVTGKLDGVKTVSVNLLTGTMQVEFDETVTDEEKIVTAVEGAGYGAYPDEARGGYGEQPGGGNQCGEACATAKGAAARGDGAGGAGGSASKDALDETAQMKKRLIWSVVLLIPLMTVSMGPMLLGNHHNTENPLTMIMIQVLFLIPIVFLNRKFFVKGLPALVRGGANMDSLIAVGSGAAIVYGVFALFRIAHGYETGDMALVHKYSADIYFESAAMILTLITVGKYMEARSKGKTSQAIEKLMNLAPKTATVERDGQEIEIETWQLAPGDILVIRPGESIAAESNAMVAMDGSISLKGETRGGFFKSLARKFLNDENFFQQSFVADDEPGSVLLAPNLPGDVVVLDVGERQYMLSDGAFLAATDGVELETKTQSLGRALLGNSGGLFLMATQGHGQIALSGFGSIQAVDVKPGQKLIVDNGHLVAWDRELDYELSINTARSGLLGKVLHSQLSGEGIVLKFKGEGKVWVCSRNKGGFLTWIFSQMPQEKAVSNG